MRLKEITGFCSNSPVVLITRGGKTFYYIENEELKRITFNLPAGVYEVIGCEIVRLKRPIRYETPKLPIPEKKIKIPETFDVQIGTNPNKASTNVHEGWMKVDPSIIERDICQGLFVMGHELGHCYYFTEWKCDVFSASEMLKRGYNPSQCYYANSLCLSDKQEQRKDILFDFLTKTKAHE